MHVYKVIRTHTTSPRHLRTHYSSSFIPSPACVLILPSFCKACLTTFVFCLTNNSGGSGMTRQQGMHSRRATQSAWRGGSHLSCLVRCPVNLSREGGEGRTGEGYK